MAGFVYQARVSNMNDITRCPNCQTAFRVTEAQLAAHRGKVRCGRCAFVFNAKDCLESEQLAETLSSTQNTATEAASHPVNTAVDSPPAEPLTASPEPLPFAEQAASIAEPRVDFVAMAMQSSAADIQYEAMPATEAHAPSAEITEPAPQQTAPALAEAMSEPAVIPPAKETSSYRPIYMDDDHLLAPAPVLRSKWYAVYMAVIVLLMLSFAAQLAYHQRTQISMELPWLRPKLISACQALGCSMPLPQNTEMLRSEWSELSYVPEFPNIIQLNATLRNLAQYEQALPMLEVTLTDDQEHIVLKKVFKPSEYLSSHDKKRLQFDAQDELRAFLQIDLGELHSTAYSIYWFYP